MDDEIISFVACYLGMRKEDLQSTTRLFEDLGLDSLGFLDLINEVSDEYGVEFEMSDIPSIVTMNDLMKLILIDEE